MSAIRFLLVFFAGASLGAILIYAAPGLRPASQNAAPPAGPAPADSRIPVELSAAGRQHIRQQMIKYLQGMSVLSDAIRYDDFETIKAVSEDLGTPDPTSSGIVKDAPEGFRQISKAMRNDFASLGLAAEPGKTEELEDTFGAILIKCSSCHGSYRADTPSP